MWCSWILLGLWKVSLVLKLTSIYLQHHNAHVSFENTKNVRLEIDNDASADPCRAFSSCAACTNSRYPSMLLDHVFDQTLTTRTTEYSRVAGVAWPYHRPSCEWCPMDQTCYSESELKDESICFSTQVNRTLTIPTEYDCPLGPTPYPDDPPELLPDWMGTMLATAPDALEELTLLDWSLPGTHDSLTYDLSETVSDDGLDDFQHLADILHALSGNELLPGELEEFFRLQAKTQQLTLTQQLDNGIRFVDVRIMMEHDNREWYSIHFMQSRQPIIQYWHEIRTWLDAHPQEIVVLWLSRHGSTGATGQDQYPDVTPEQKQQLWSEYKSIFAGLLLDTRESDLYTTSLAELLRRKHRVVTFASDYADFTDASPFALDAAKIENVSGGGVFDEVNVMERNTEYFQSGAANNKAVNAKGGFTLLSMNTSSPPWQVMNAAKRRFLHWILGDNAFELESFFHSCASKTNIPGLTKWCPETLMDIVQLTSYYNHMVMDSAFTSMWTDTEVAFPNAFYLDGLDYDGTFRTGTQLLDGMERSQTTNKGSKYAYVDTVLAYNARKLCESGEQSSSGAIAACRDLLRLIDKRRSKYPLQMWEEPSFGRHTNWPLPPNGDSTPTTPK